MINFKEKLNLDDFTPLEIEVIEYISTYSERIPSMTLHELSEVTFASNATIVRICKKFGYSGYNEFRYDLRKQAHNTANELHLTSHISDSILYMNELIHDIPPKYIQEIANLIHSDKTIYLFSTSQLQVPLMHFYNQLISLDVMCMKYSDIHLMCDAAQSMSEKDVVFILDMGSSNESLLEMAQLIKSNKALLISIIATQHSNLEAISDMTLYANAQKRVFNHQVDVTSQLGILILLQLIIEYYLKIK